MVWVLEDCICVVTVAVIILMIIIIIIIIIITFVLKSVEGINMICTLGFMMYLIRVQLVVMFGNLWQTCARGGVSKVWWEDWLGVRKFKKIIVIIIIVIVTISRGMSIIITIIRLAPVMVVFTIQIITIIITL